MLKVPLEKLDSSYSLSVKEVFNLLSSSAEGLSPKEAELRLKTYGENKLLEEDPRKTLKLFLSQFKNFFVWLLIFASGLSLAFESIFTGLLLFAIAAFNVFVSFFQERKAAETIKALKAIYPDNTEVIRGGEPRSIEAAELTYGDIVVLREGERVPADLRLFHASSLKIDESHLTGESVPEEKDRSVLPKDTAPSERENMAYAGTSVVAGFGKGVVVGIADDTEFGKVSALVGKVQEESLLLKRVRSLGFWITAFSFISAAFIFTLGYFRGAEPVSLLKFTIALLVSAVPESLPTVLTLALTATAFKLSKKHALVRKLTAVESLSGVNVFCFDKTGTLTENELAVEVVELPDKTFWVSGTGFSSTGAITLDGNLVDISKELDLQKLLEAAVVNNNASLDLNQAQERWEVLGDPTEGALLILAKKAGIEQPEEVSVKKEFSFTSQRRMMSKVVFRDGVTQVFSKGAPEKILELSTKLLKDGKIQNLSHARRKELKERQEQLAQKGYRVLSFGFKDVRKEGIRGAEVEKDLVFIGFVGLLDKPKKHAEELVTSLKDAFITPVIITGDHLSAAKAVAASIGIEVSSKSVLDGQTLGSLSDEEFRALAPRIRVYARTSPTQKIKIVEALRAHGLVVAMTGDGVNDAAALRAADVGIVMDNGTDVSKQEADLVLMDNKLESILPVIMQARTLYDNLKKFFVFLLSGNFVEVLIIAGAFLAGLPQPLTMLQILWVNLVIDIFPALALSFDPPSRAVLFEPPRDLSPNMVKPLLKDSAVIGILALVAQSWVFLNYVHEPELARTMFFVTASVVPLTIVFSIRSTHHFFLRRIFKSKKLVLGVIASYGLLFLALTEPLKTFFEVSNMGRIEWITVFAVALFVTLGYEVWKAFGLRRMPHALLKSR